MTIKQAIIILEDYLFELKCKTGENSKIKYGEMKADGHQAQYCYEDWVPIRNFICDKTAEQKKSTMVKNRNRKVEGLGIKILDM